MALGDLAVLDPDGSLVTDDEALGHVYAAYRRGALVFGDLKPDLEPQSFAMTFGRWLQQVIAEGSQAIIIRAKVGENVMPVGLAVIDYQGKTAYPDFHWFPEASPRNRIEAALVFMLELKKEHLVFFTVPGTGRKPSGDWKFLMFLCKYGVLRPVGTIYDHDGKGKHATLFQSVGH